MIDDKGAAHAIAQADIKRIPHIRILPRLNIAGSIGIMHQPAGVGIYLQISSFDLPVKFKVRP